MERHKSTPGQSGSEYAMALGLVAVVGIATLAALGGGLSNIFFGMVTGQPKAEPPATPSESLPGKAAADDYQAALAKLPPAPQGTEPVCFDAVCVNLPIVDASNAVVDTVGGNGADRIYQFSDTLQQLAEQLEDSGVDPGLVQLISKLANNGHGLGDAQKALDPAFRGFRLSPSQQSGYDNAKSEFSSAYAAINQYLSANPSQLKSTSVNMINAQVQQINTLANAISFGNVTAGKGSYPAAYGGKATLTHQSANTVCRQGGRNCYRPEGNSAAFGKVNNSPGS